MSHNRCMPAADYFDRITALVCRVFDVDPATVDVDTPFAEMGVDSRQRVRLLVEVEVEFGLEIDLDELDRLVDIRNAAEVLADTIEGDRPVVHLAQRTG